MNIIIMSLNRLTFHICMREVLNLSIIFYMYIITVNSSLYIFTYLVLGLCIYVIVIVPVHTSLSKLLYILFG